MARAIFVPIVSLGLLATLLAVSPVQVTAPIYSQATGQQECDSSGQAFAAVAVLEQAVGEDPSHLPSRVALSRAFVRLYEDIGEATWMRRAVAEAGGILVEDETPALQRTQRSPLHIPPIFHLVRSGSRLTVTPASRTPLSSRSSFSASPCRQTRPCRAFS